LQSSRPAYGGWLTFGVSEMNEQSRFLQTAPSIFEGLAASTIGLRHALATYLAEGRRLGFSQGELIDLLGVSSDSVLDLANFSDTEQEHAMSILGKLTDTEIQDATKHV